MTPRNRKKVDSVPPEGYDTPPDGAVDPELDMSWMIDESEEEFWEHEDFDD